LLGEMAHTCNPSYSGDRDWEDHGSLPTWTESSWDPIWTNGCLWWACLSSQLHEEAQIGGSCLGWPRHKARPYLKNN
jgi:hypothetical protein